MILNILMMKTIGKMKFIMTNKHWKEILNENNEKVYILYFKPFNDKEELIRFAKDKNGDYIYSSDILNVENDYLDCEKKIQLNI